MPASPSNAENLADETRRVYEQAELRLLALIGSYLAKDLDAPDWAELKLLQMQLLQGQADQIMVLFQKDSIIASLDVTPATTTKAAAATQQLVATAHRTNGDSTQVVTSDTVWTTSDATKATVNAAGLITAVATGSATITGTYRGKTDTCVVTVS